MAVRVTDNHGLVWNATIDDTELNQIAAKIEGRVGAMGQSVKREGDKMGETFNRLATIGAAFFTAQQGVQLVNSIINVRGEFQQLEIAFSTMLGSKEKANKLMSEAVQLAATTPFGLQDVASGAKQLLAYGFAADDITDNITRLGNIASGVGSQLNDVIYLYGTLKASGRVTQMDINQFAGRGIPIYDALSKVLGKTAAEVREMVSAGQVGFPHIEKAFQNLTNEGGMFYNLMAAQSKSLTGQISNLKDSISQMLNEIGQGTEGFASSGIAGLAYLVEHYKEIGKILAILITTYGAYRTAMVLTNVLNGTLAVSTGVYDVATKRLVISKTLATAATNVLSAAQARLNAVMAINPYVAIITAVAALGAAMYVLSDNTSAAERIQRRYDETLKENAKTIDDIKNKTNDLVATVNDDTQTKASQILAFQQLQELYKGRLKDLTLEEFQLQSTTEQQKRFNQELQNISLDDLKKEYETALAYANKLATTSKEIGSTGVRQRVDNSMSQEYKNALEIADKIKIRITDIEYAEKLAGMTAEQTTEYYRQQMNPLQQQIAAWETTYGKIQQNNDGSYSLQNTWNSFQINGAIRQWNHLLGLVNSVTAASGGVVKSTPNQFKQEADKAREDAGNEADPTIRANLLKKAETAEKKYNEMMGRTAKTVAGTSKASQKASSSSRKSAEDQKRALENLTEAERQATIDRMAEGEKQVAEIKYRFKKMREAMEQAGVKDTAAFGRIDVLEKQALDDNRDENNTKKIEKELNEQKELYKKFEDAKKDFGIEAATYLYGNLTGKYVSYLDRLQSEYDKLEKKGQPLEFGGGGGLNPAESNLFSEIKEKLTEAREEEARDSIVWQAQAIGQYGTYEQLKLGIINKYSRERKKALDANRAELLNGINQAEQDELLTLRANNSEKLASAAQYTQGMVYLTKKAAQQQLDIFNSLLASESLPEVIKNELTKKVDEITFLLGQPLKKFSDSQLDAEIEKQEAALLALAQSGDAASDTFGQINDRITQLKNQKAENSIGNIRNALSALSQLTPALNSLSEALNETGNNTARQIGGVLANLAEGGLKLLETFEKIKTEGVSTIDAIGAAAQFVINTISTIVSSARAQKKAYEDFYIQNLNFQNDYNNSLIEEIRLRQGIRDSVFFTDYSGKIKAGLAAEVKAVKEYNEALANLQNASVITGQKKVRDWGAVLGSTLSGAATGAVIGASGAGVAAIPGAIIGGIVGLVGGLLKKRNVVNVYDGLLKTYPQLIDAQGNLNEAMASAIISSGKIEGSSRETLQYLLSMNEQYVAAKEQIESVISELAGSLGSDLMGSLFDDWASGGENAGKAFTEGVSKSLASIGKNLLFNAVFGDDFVALQEKIKQGFKTTGDPSSMVSALIEFNDEASAKGAAFQALLTEYQKQLEAKGISDVFGLAEENKSKTNSLSGALSAASQESIDLLAGHTMGMRVAQLETNRLLSWGFTDTLLVANQSLEQVVRIQQNTANTVIRLDTVITEFKTLNRKVQSGSDVALAMGGV